MEILKTEWLLEEGGEVAATATEFKCTECTKTFGVPLEVSKEWTANSVCKCAECVDKEAADKPAAEESDKTQSEIDKALGK